MGRKKRKKKKKSSTENIKTKSKGFAVRRPQAEFTGFRYYQMPLPVRGMSQEKTNEAIQKLGGKFEQQFETSLEKLREKALKVEPCSLLSLFSNYDLTTSPGVNREFTEEDPILQHHVEFLQGLLLQYSPDSFDSTPALPEDFVEIRQLVQDVTEGFPMRRLAATDSSLPVEQRQQIRLLESIRAETQAIRNWAYPQQTRRIVSDLFSSLDDEIEQKTGVRIAYLVEMWFNLCELIEGKINQHRNLVLSALRAKNIKTVTKRYYQAFPDSNLSPDELLDIVKDNNLNLDNVRAILLGDSDIKLSEIFTLTIQDFVDAYPQTINPNLLKNVLTTWTLSFGDLSNFNTEYLFLGNPVWKKPLIKLNDKTYFCPILTLFLNYLTELMEAVIKPYTELYQKYEERRGKFLEEEIYRLFHEAFPSAKIYRGSNWVDPITQKNFENDLLVLLDSHLLVVEAKSGRVTETTRRGAVGSLKKILKRLVVEPSIQSKRFADYLRDNPGLHTFKNYKGEMNEIDNSNVHEIIRLSVTLESLSTIFCRSTDLKEAGLIPSNLQISPTILLADLEIIFEILEGSCEKLHYLMRREEFEQNAEYIGEEIDLLGFYLDTGFNIGELDFKHNTHNKLCFSGASNIFDPFFLKELPEKETPKPKRKLTDWWRKIIHRIETQQFQRWTEAGCMLLNFAYNEQLEFEKNFKHTKKVVNKSWEKPDHINTCILINEIAPERGAVAGLAYKRLSREKRNLTIENTIEQTMDISEVNQVFVIGVDVEHNDYPYTVGGYYPSQEKDNSC